MSFHLRLNPTHRNPRTGRISLTDRMYYRFHLRLNLAQQNSLTARIYYTGRICYKLDIETQEPVGFATGRISLTGQISLSFSTIWVLTKSS
jgi:hypothetical protein